MATDQEEQYNKCEKSFPGDHFSKHGDDRKWEKCDCKYCTPKQKETKS